MSKKIKVAQFGLGPIGCSCVQLLAERTEYEIVGGIDIAPELAGKRMAEEIGRASCRERV